MCTLLILRQDKKVIAVMNRDDETLRVEEGVREFEGGVLSPVDVRSGGTWIGVNEAGVGGFLLNRYDECAIENKKSRGDIVLNVLSVGILEHCIAFIDSSDFSSYLPFTLVLYFDGKIVKFDWNGRSMTKVESELENYFVLTSSSIEEEKVKKWRYDSFNHWYQGDQKFINGVPAFNLLQVKGHEDYCVMVKRKKVCTLSITIFCFDVNKVDITYLPRDQIEKIIVNG